MTSRLFRTLRHATGLFALVLLSSPDCGRLGAAESGGLTFEQLAAIRRVLEVRVSPGGEHVAYTLAVPRKPGVDEDGPDREELHLVSTADGARRPFITGEIEVSGIRFTPDGRFITYLAERDDDEHTAIWAIPVDGGESRRLLEFESEIRQYRVSPDGARLAFVAREPDSEAREDAKEKGYDQEVFEEDWRPLKAWITGRPLFEAPVEEPSADDDETDGEEEPRALELDGSVFELEWSPDGEHLAVSLAPRPLVDDRYMFRRIHVVDATRGETRARLDNPGKLGEFAFSPDGRNIAMISAADPNDPSPGRLQVAPAAGGPLRDLLPGFEGHVRSFAFRDADTLVYLADVGVESRLGEVDLQGGGERILLSSGSGEDGSRSPFLRRLDLSADGRSAALVGESPLHPPEVYFLTLDGAGARRLTDSNPWLAAVALAPQETVRWTARDGLELEGILIRPLGPTAEGPAPLILMVHGGPEGNDRNGWVTRYSRPGQLAAAAGYAVLYPNYRGSTGRGVAFSKRGQGDAAGKEFDDLVDAVDHLVRAGIADEDRVGITGGSYGGYATAWCATRHTDRFRAGVMFVGISNKLTKALTTEIPVEDRMVHTLFDPWTRWEFSLERSPISHVEKSRTALLIAGGTDDSRVDPSQSLQLYRALKQIGKTPVRYVRYPGEGHGNRRAAARDDYVRRLMRWMDHFLVAGKNDLPPWDLEPAIVSD